MGTSVTADPAGAAFALRRDDGHSLSLTRIRDPDTGVEMLQIAVDESLFALSASTAAAFGKLICVEASTIRQGRR